MIELPIWVWVVSVLGVIAAGIGLAYLIIFLFWKIEKHFSPKPDHRRYISEELNLEEKEKEAMPEKGILEEEKAEEIIEEAEEEPIPEQENIEIAPVFIEPLYDKKHRLIKFATTLSPRFKHPFREADTIVCWDIGVQNGAEIRDTEDNVRNLRVIEPQSEAKSDRVFLVDDSGQRAISVITVKEYLKREANLDVDKMKIQQ